MLDRMEIKENVIQFLIPQTSCVYPINDYGCNLRSLQAMAELKTRENLLVTQIEDMYNKAVNLGWCEDNCYINKPENIVNAVFELKQSKYKAWNCGKFVDGEALSWKGHPIKFDYSIIKLWQPDMKSKHFVLGDTDFNLVFDPYPDSVSVKAWNIKDIYLYSFYS